MSGLWRRNSIGSSVSLSTSRTSVVWSAAVSRACDCTQIAMLSHGICTTASYGMRQKVSPLSVISAKVKLALRCKSTLSEKTSVLSARNGSPEKKSVSPRCSVVSYDGVPGSYDDVRFLSIVTSLPPPPSRCRPELVRISCRGTCLESSCQIEVSRAECMTGMYLCSRMSIWHP